MMIDVISNRPLYFFTKRTLVDVVGIMGLFYWDMIPGSLKKQPSLSHSLRRNLRAPFPPIQCCYVALLGKAFKIKAISVRMPACIGQQH